MKKILLACSIIALLTASCTKDFLNTTPTDRISAASAFNTTKDALTVLNGVHRGTYFREDQGNYGYPSMMVYGDMLGEDLVMTGVGNGWYNAEYRWLQHRNENSGLVSYSYRFYYDLLVNVNLILENIDKATGLQADRNFIKASALTYRAFCHFNLVQLFGKRYQKGVINNQLGVPLMLASTIVPQPRETVEKVYEQVNADLNSSILLFASSAARPNKSHFNINIARGIKARVALAQQNWAAAAAEAVAARSGFTLMSNAQYGEGFSDYSNPEWMWAIDQIDDQSGFFGAFHSYMSCNYNSTNIRTNPKAINRLIYNVLPTTDVRRLMWDATGSASAITPPGGLRRPYMTQKFRLLGSPSTTTQGDVPYMRVAEMFLIEAEAQARLALETGDLAATTSARAALFILVKNRNAAYVLSTNSGTALADEIMLHRRVELWGEGFRFLDLKRLNLPLNRNSSNHTVALANILDVPAGSKDWEFLIPRAELNANKLVEQNPL